MRSQRRSRHRNSQVALNARGFRPSIEAFERRELMAGNFLQGFVTAGTTPLVGATVTLYSLPSVTQVGSPQTIASGGDGSYLFSGLSAGQYRLVETPPVNYANSSTSAATQLDQVTATTASSIDVTIGDSGTAASPNWFLTTFGSNKEPLSFAGPTPPLNNSVHNSAVGSLAVDVNETDVPYTTATFSTYCVDLNRDVQPYPYGNDANLPYAIVPLDQALAAADGTSAANAGRIAYLYNTYGQAPLTPSQSVGLQLAIWELEYDPSPVDVTSGSFHAAIDSSLGQGYFDTSANAFGNNYLADSVGHNEKAVFLNGLPSAEYSAGSQGLLATGSFNFGNQPKATPAIPMIGTTQQPANATVGTSIADLVTVTGGNSPTGTVTFNLYNNPNGTGAPLFTDTEALSGGTATSAGYIATAAGTDYWVATYNGDANNAPITAPTASEPVTVIPAAPAINTRATASAGGVVGLSQLTDSATLTGGYNPTGTITFTLTTPNGAVLQEGSVAVTGDKTYASPYSVLATQVGAYTWHASYSGDANNAPAADNGANEGVTTVKSTPAINTTQLPTTAVVGSSIADKATVSGGYNPTGTVTFKLYGNSTGSGTPLFTDTEALSGGTATSKGYTATAAGTDYWVATYNGDINNSSVTAPTASEPVCVTKASPAIVTTPNQAVVEQGTATTLTDTATLSGGFGETGTITFTLVGANNKVLDTETVKVNGDGSYTTPKGYSLPANAAQGIYQWNATYCGDSNNVSATDSNNAAEQVTVVTCGQYQNVSFTVYDSTGHLVGTFGDLRGNIDQGDTVVVNFTIPAGDYEQPSLVSYTAPESSYNFNSAKYQTVYQSTTQVFGPGRHSLTVTLPDSFYQVDFVCGSVIQTLGLDSNDTYSAQGRLLSADNGGINPVGSAQLTVSGTVFSDLNSDGKFGGKDQGVAGATVTLTGVDAYGIAISMTTTSDSNGLYSFGGLPFSNPAGYTVTLTTPSGQISGVATAGSLGGTPKSSPESVASIVMANSTHTTATGYNFGLIGPAVCKGQTQSSSYWCGGQGQSLINCLNGGSSSKGLGNWLAATCPNLFGNLKGCTNSQVASYCKSLNNGNSNQNACGQVLSSAIGAYVTDSDLAGNSAQSYGFTVSSFGLGSSTWNVGWSGSGVGLSNNQTYSIFALLAQVDGQSSNGSLKSSTVGTVNSLFSGINQF